MSDVAASMAGELIAEAQEYEPYQEPEASVVAEQAEEVEDVPVDTAFEVALPDHIEALLEVDEPDTIAQVEYQPVAEEEPEYWGDDEAEKLRIQLAKEKKRAAFLEQQAIRVQRPRWQEEIEKYFPFVDAKKIASEATSHRDAIRKAKELNDLAAVGAKRVQDHYEKNLEKILAERDAELQARLKAQWGEPLGGPGPAPAEASERSERESQIRNARTLHERTLLKIRAGLL